MDLLMLGGTRFVGRAVIADALARGWSVTALHRGVTGSVPEGVESILVDRTDGPGLFAAVEGRGWDLVVDTWSGAPRVVVIAADALAGRVSHYGYVSSCSVYEWGRHVDVTRRAGAPARRSRHPRPARGARTAVAGNA